MKQQSLVSLGTIANAAELAVRVIENISDSCISKTVAGAEVNKNIHFQHVQSSLQKEIEQKLNQ